MASLNNSGNGGISDAVLKKRKRRIHQRHKLAIGTATIRSDINVTPLVDVVLVLLIIFMVVTPMITRGKNVEMIETQHHDQKSDSGEQIVVSVTCNGPRMAVDKWTCESSSVYVGTEKAEGEQAIVDKVQQEMRAHAGREIYLKADRRLPYGMVRDAMEHVHAAGVGAVSLGSEELKKEN